MQTRDEIEILFDRWVRETLAEKHGAALTEPLPEALLRVLAAVPAATAAPAAPAAA